MEEFKDNDTIIKLFFLKTTSSLSAILKVGNTKHGKEWSRTLETKHDWT